MVELLPTAADRRLPVPTVAAEGGSTSRSSDTPSATAGAPDSTLAAGHISKSDRRAITSVTTLFVRSAVRRDHPELSWPIAHPLLRQGLSVRQWRTGNIPVIPFPAARIAVMKLDAATSQRALLEIVLVPTRQSHLVMKTFLIELRHTPARIGPRWLVSSWAPYGVSQTQIGAAFTGSSARAERRQPTHLSGTWLLVPLALLASMPAILVAMAIINTRRNRAAERAYRKGLLYRAESSSTTRPS
jgi:hypothetical protein